MICRSSAPSSAPRRCTGSSPCSRNCHGQILNVAELATALNLAQATVRRYLDLLEQLYLIRQLRPWHENFRKRQVKRPKLYVRDSGLYHHLLGVGTMDALLTHPRIGASWEGFVLEKVIAESSPEEVYFWATHNGAELDLLLLRRGRRVGVEIKRVERAAPHPIDGGRRGTTCGWMRCTWCTHGEARYVIGEEDHRGAGRRAVPGGRPQGGWWRSGSGGAAGREEPEGGRAGSACRTRSPRPRRPAWIGPHPGGAACPT